MKKTSLKLQQEAYSAPCCEHLPMELFGILCASVNGLGIIEGSDVVDDTTDWNL